MTIDAKKLRKVLAAIRDGELIILDKDLMVALLDAYEALATVEIELKAALDNRLDPSRIATAYAAARAALRARSTP